MPKMGISEAAFHVGKRKYQYKRMYVELAHENYALKELIQKKLYDRLSAVRRADIWWRPLRCQYGGHAQQWVYRSRRITSPVSIG